MWAARPPTSEADRVVSGGEGACGVPAIGEGKGGCGSECGREGDSSPAKKKVKQPLEWLFETKKINR